MRVRKKNKSNPEILKNSTQWKNKKRLKKQKWKGNDVESRSLYLTENKKIGEGRRLKTKKKNEKVISTWLLKGLTLKGKRKRQRQSEGELVFSVSNK